MTLEKAIKILELFVHAPWLAPVGEDIEAAKLGIEALKRCLYFDRCDFKGKKFLLPGETEDLAR
uniref:Uncharacterized protein n=1 Tax=viral metagenome TaxID=1070528 RepID=A0A6H2A454_9ZZZZ